MSDVRTVVFAAAALLAAASARATVPVPGYIYPSSLQVGTSARILVGGMFMREVKGAVVTGGGVKVTRVVQVPGFPRAVGKTQIPWTKEWFYDILAGKREKRDLPPERTSETTDWHECDWWEHLDEHDQLELEIICRFWHTPENYPQPTPALDQLVIFDLEVDPAAKPGMREFFVYSNREISAPHPFFLTKEPHVVEPSYVIPTKENDRMPLPYVLHIPPTLPVARPPCVLDGQAWPGEIDSFRVQLKKGVRYTFETTARELLPYQGDAVPGFFNPVVRLADPSGKEIAFEDDFYYLPDPILSCVAPVDGIYTFQIYDNLFRGRQDCVYVIRCYEDSPSGHSYTPQERAFACYPPPSAHVPPQAGEGVSVYRGTIDCPGRVIRHNFSVSEPSTLQFELFARRTGSPVDGVIRLYGPLAKGVPVSSAPLLAEWDDVDKFLAGTIPQAIADPRGSWTFLEAGDYSVTVADRYEAGGDHNDYTLVIAKRQPDFEIYSENSSFQVIDGRAVIRLRIVPLNGFTGEVTIEDTEDFACGSPVKDEKGPLHTLVIEAKDWKWTGIKTAQFKATATVGRDKRKIVRRVTPADPAEQAFAYTHLLPQRAFFFFRPGEDDAP